MVSKQSDQSLSLIQQLAQMSEDGAKELATKLTERWGDRIFQTPHHASDFRHFHISTVFPIIRDEHEHSTSRWLSSTRQSSTLDLRRLISLISTEEDLQTWRNAMLHEFSPAQDNNAATSSSLPDTSGNAQPIADFAAIEKSLADTISALKAEEGDAELEELKALVRLAIEQKLGSPEDHLNSIREKLRQVSSHVDL